MACDVSPVAMFLHNFCFHTGPRKTWSKNIMLPTRGVIRPFRCLDKCSSTLPECPEGYILVEGDVGGYGNVGDPPSVPDQELGSCAALCNHLPDDCCSFEWSPTERRCNLNQECAPTKNKFRDYLFCVKGALDTIFKTQNLLELLKMRKIQLTHATIGPQKRNLKLRHHQKRQSVKISDMSLLKVFPFF